MKSIRTILDDLERNPVERHDPLVSSGSAAELIEGPKGLGFSNADVVSRVGMGTFAEVYECRPNETTIAGNFALKVEKPLKHAAGILLNEINILEALSGTGVTPEYLGEFNLKVAGFDCLAAGLELFEDSLSSLKNYKRDSKDALPVEFRDWLMVSMFNCIFRMHAHGYLHRDIKPSNVMYKLSRDQCVRLALVDLGSAIRIGEKNQVPFRGTGAYSGLGSDPMESRPLDDYWSTAFSVLELSLDGGLPWRNISSRSEEGRAEILKQKNELLTLIFQGKIPNVSPFCAQVLALLFHSSPSDSIESQFRKLESDFPISISPSLILDILRPQNCWRLDLPKSVRKIPIPSLLLDKENRDLLSCVKSHCYPFTVPENSALLEGVLSLLAAAGAQNSTFPSEFFCLFEIRGKSCNVPKCPLVHVPGQGIVRSAILRSLRRNPVCIERLIDGRVCRASECSFRHLSVDEIKEIFSLSD